MANFFAGAGVSDAEFTSQPTDEHAQLCASGLVARPTHRIQAMRVRRGVAAFQDAVVVRDAGIGLSEILPTMKAKRAVALLLLFRTTEPAPDAPRYATYAHVAKLLNMSYGKVYYLAQKAQPRDKHDRK